ncbi:MAG: tetratricopeptide repeat protein, partial [Planctomycetia bacterium]|nr:tetratricopeptide repeat protein [Planctomycetia bacterium]
DGGRSSGRTAVKSAPEDGSASGGVDGGNEECSLDGGTASDCGDVSDESTESVGAETEEVDSTISLPLLMASKDMSVLMDEAAALEDAGQVDEAIRTLRLAAAMYGARAETSFRLAELLYRSGDLPAARERYFVAIELDEDYVEARASLGCVLVEEGKTDLAIAAFEGALKQYPEYADVHYHLAGIFQSRYDEAIAEYEQERMPLFPDRIFRGDGVDPASPEDEAALQREHWRNLARRHWRRFLELAPSGPWADEAARRLADSGPICGDG